MHRIRLRRPWTRTIDGQHESRVDVPDIAANDLPVDAPLRTVEADLVGSRGGTGNAMAAEYQRKFNRPSGLDEASSVALSISDWTGTLKAVQVNEHAVELCDSVSPPLRLEISSLLQSHNELTIELAGNDQASGRLTGEVQIEIDEPQA